MGPQPLLPIFLFSLCVLPLSLWLAVALSIYLKARPYLTQNWPSSPLAVRRRILLTGDDDGAILATARALKASGSTVYVVKQERIPFTSCLSTSKAVHKYIGLASGRLTPILRRLTKGTRIRFALPANLPGAILHLVESERIDLWIQCGSSRQFLALTQAREIVLKHTRTKLFEADADTARLARGYSLFAHHMKQHEVEVQTPKTIIVRSRAEIHNVLWKAGKAQQFLLEKSYAALPGVPLKANSGTKRTLEYDDGATLVGGSSDSDDFDGVETSTPRNEDYTQLPGLTANQTYSTVAAIEISPAAPWILHEVITGRSGTISALVVQGKVRAFTAEVANEESSYTNAINRSPLSAKSSMKFDSGMRGMRSVIDPKSSIGMSLFHFAQCFASSLDEKPSTYLHLHFYLTDRSTGGGAEQKIIATGCDFNPAPRLVQQALASRLAEEFGRAITQGKDDFHEDNVLLLPSSSDDTRANIRSPAIKLPRASTSRGESLNALAASLEQLINEQDARYDRKDLVPCIWFWLVQGPIEIAFEGLVQLLENEETRTRRI